MEETYILKIDEEFGPLMSVEEAENLKSIQKEFMESYLEKKDTMAIDEWLYMEMSEHLPELTTEEVSSMSKEIIDTLKIQEEKRVSLEKAIENGRSKESWFANEVKVATSYMSTQDAVKYLHNLDDALNNANNSLYNTIHTQAGTGPISQNRCLDGFIAEQYHAQTFNLKAEASGSPYRAKVLEPNGNGYAKNSVDIVIVDESGHVVRRYQSKYYKDSNSTAKSFEKGDYRGQRKLAPSDQVTESDNGQTYIGDKLATDRIEAPDGISSTPLSKERAKELQSEAQSGKWNDLNWNEYQIKDLAIGIGKQAGQAALMGAAVGVGFDMAQKVWNGEEIKGEELLETAIISGADFGVKAAAAGALKVGVEKGMVRAIPKGTPAGTIANIAHVAIENVKIVGKMVTGELTVKEGFDKMEQTTVATVAGIATAAKGAAIGAKIGTVFGPVGTAVGGFIGGTIGYMAGSKVAETVVKGVQKIREKAKDTIRTIGEKVSNAVDSFVGELCSFFW